MSTLRGGGDNCTQGAQSHLMLTRGDFEGWRGQLYRDPFLYSIDVTSKLQIMKISRVWLYIVQSHLMYLVYVREVTLRGEGEHAR